MGDRTAILPPRPGHGTRVKRQVSRTGHPTAPDKRTTAGAAKRPKAIRSINQSINQARLLPSPLHVRATTRRLRSDHGRPPRADRWQGLARSAAPRLETCGPPLREPPRRPREQRFGHRLFCSASCWRDWELTLIGCLSQPRLAR
eukprot:scaffold2740_cov418-Prasinococcus_capsulatus_cf.AAC.6